MAGGGHSLWRKLISGAEILIVNQNPASITIFDNMKLQLSSRSDRLTTPQLGGPKATKQPIGITECA